MHIYLPVAETSINIFLLIGLGGGVGLLSGLFGVGGGFLMTPLLLFINIPPAVAVASEANQLVASSVSGSLAWRQRKGVDVKMGLVLAAGGLLGSGLGVWLFRLFRQLGQLELVIALGYMFLLGTIGTLMLAESCRALLALYRNKTSKLVRPSRHTWLHGLPLRTKFRTSALYASILPPLVLGAIVGFLAAILGTGGGFIMVPALIYLLRIPIGVVIGTSLFQILFVTIAVTLLHAIINQSVDIVLASFLMLGSVVGAQFGVRLAQRLPAEHLRGLLAVVILAVATKLGLDFVIEPAQLFHITIAKG